MQTPLGGSTHKLLSSFRSPEQQGAPLTQPGGGGNLGSPGQMEDEGGKNKLLLLSATQRQDETTSHLLSEQGSINLCRIRHQKGASVNNGTSYHSGANSSVEACSAVKYNG